MGDKSDDQRKSEEQRKSEYERSDRTMQLVGLVMAVGVGGIVLYALHFSPASQFASIAGVALVMAGASAMAGALLGFLFGIPRTFTKKSIEASSGTTSEIEDRGTQYQVNTNLEEISDWLTKILVGVGLTELRRFPTAIETLARKLGPVLGDVPSSGAFAVTMLLFFSICGFLESYLWTRLFLAGQFRLADLAVLGAQVKQTQEAVQHLADQHHRDARAIALALSQLNPAPGTSPVSQTDLNDAIRAASTMARAQIFYQAQSMRTAEWNRDKTKMELTIPIFISLIASDPEQKYHRNHGQLGYALKDKRTPDWSEAEKELSLAIKIRGGWEEGGWLWYEFNRAACRIAQNSSFQHNRPSDPAIREKILEDLRAAATVLQPYFEREERISAWLTLNTTAPEDLQEKREGK